MTAQELKETGQKLSKSGQFAEAIPLLKSAADALPDDESLWGELVVAARDSGQDGQAIEFAKLGIRNHPRSDWLWQELGGRLIAVDKLDEAEKALDNARKLNPDSLWAWRYLTRLHQKRKNYAKEIEAWGKLRDLGEMDGADLNQIGIAYYNHENFAMAVEFYRQSAMKLPDTSAFFNLGLVLNHPEVSQDADAADAYRCALMLNPNYENAKERLETTKKKLLPLAESARVEAGGLIKPDEYFQFYLNPFEVFQVSGLHGNEGQNQSIEVDADGIARPQLLHRSGSALDIKAIHRAKKRLLQEIELNDGRVNWLENQPIDKSRALALEDEFLGEEKQGFHRAVFNNRRLLQFLTRGDIEHFLYSDEYFPEEILELLDNGPEFRHFISKLFARQYNFIFVRAIQNHKLAVVEALLDGRRWVEPEDEDICFAGAYKHTKMLIEWVETKVLNAAKTKPDYSEITGYIEHLAVAETFNLLPTAFFRDDQCRIVEQIRLLAVAAHNEHSDSELSNRILRLCKRFNFKSADLNKQLEEDLKTIEQILSAQQYAKDTSAERERGNDQTPNLGFGNDSQSAERERRPQSAEQQREPNWVFGNDSQSAERQRRPQSTGRQRKPQPEKNYASVWWLYGAILFIVVTVIANIPSSSSNSSTKQPGDNRATYTTPSFPGTPNSESKTTYRTPSYATAELERDRKAIDAEKAKAERMAAQLETLAREIEQERVYLDHTSQLTIDQFNAKVNAYNALLEKVRIQDRLVNQMVDNYNTKLRNYDK